MDKIELFLQKEIQKPKNRLLKELYERNNFSNEELLYLFPNNKLKRFGLPMKKGGSKKKQIKRNIIRSQPLFNIIEDIIDDTLRNQDYLENKFFEQFVDFRNLNIGDTNTFYVSDYEEQCKGELDEYFRETRYSAVNKSNRPS